MTYPHDDTYPYWLFQQQDRRYMANLLASLQGSADELPISQPGGILLQAVLEFGARVPEGQLITAVAIPWFEIVALMQREPDTIYQIDWRKWEEIIAGAYRRQGFEVVLTPRSNDKGRDVIATHRGLGSIRFYDQVKAYAPGRIVTAEEVHAMVGVLSLQPNVSKGVITTTATFAPGVLRDPDIARLVPFRLELKDRDTLLPWLSGLAGQETQR